MSDLRGSHTVLEKEIERFTAELKDLHSMDSHADLTIDRLHAELAEANKRIEELMKIVMEVSTVYPGETRAETAQRYVRERENRPMRCAGRSLDGEE